jgi:hypothetical protein
MVQMSAESCDLEPSASRPLCADTCAEYAQSEALITADKNLCSNPNQDLGDLIRADFTICGLPEQSLSGSCVSGSENEAENCGFANSTLGLCSYCGSGGTNSTDTCCYNSKAESRCEGVNLPTITPTLTFITATESPSSTSTSTSSPDEAGSDGDDGKDGGGGLSGGAIAGIVIGSLAGVALLAGLLFCCIRFVKRRRGSQAGSIFNQPSPARKVTPNMSQSVQNDAPQGYEVLPGGRIARMSALEGHNGHSPSQHGGTHNAAYLADSKKNSDQSSSDEYGESPVYEDRHGGLRPPPTAARRNGSLSSGSVLGSEGRMSPGSNGFSSPMGLASQQSEQLPFFKDYYSQDDIHPSDRVAVLWAYSPRAGDEFTLERGDMIKVVGIWDDGWATGVMLEERAEDWDSRRHMQRDSGVSNTSGARDASPPAPTNGEMKAFPLVCVCLPQHWRKTIEGDGSTESESITAVGRSTA